jgi:hypothetical protein
VLGIVKALISIVGRRGFARTRFERTRFAGMGFGRTEFGRMAAAVAGPKLLIQWRVGFVGFPY